MADFVIYDVTSVQKCHNQQVITILINLFWIIYIINFITITQVEFVWDGIGELPVQYSLRCLYKIMIMKSTRIVFSIQKLPCLFFIIQVTVKYLRIRPVDSSPRQITLTTTLTIWTVCGRYNSTPRCKSLLNVTKLPWNTRKAAFLTTLRYWRAFQLTLQ